MRIISIFIIFLGLTACKKDKAGTAGEQVEIYLLASYQTAGNECRVIPSLARLESSPLVQNRQIKEYSAGNFAFTVTADALERIKALPGRTAFAVTIDRKVVYYGFYMPAIMSSTCFESITMDISWTNPRIFMSLGYPGIFSPQVEDQRNHPDLLRTLEAQGKLRP